LGPSFSASIKPSAIRLPVMKILSEVDPLRHGFEVLVEREADTAGRVPQLGVERVERMPRRRCFFLPGPVQRGRHPLWQPMAKFRFGFNAAVPS
jgi:hypothetical protein